MHGFKRFADGVFGIVPATVELGKQAQVRAVHRSKTRSETTGRATPWATAFGITPRRKAPFCDAHHFRWKPQPVMTWAGIR